MPIVQFATPGVTWESIELGPFRIGHFIGALITFIIIAFKLKLTSSGAFQNYFWANFLETFHFSEFLKN